MRCRLLMLCAAALALGSAAPARAASSYGLVRDLKALAATDAPGAVVLARDGARTRTYAAGFGDLRRRTPMRVGDRFRIGSVTKSFAATVVLQLAGEGRLSLDDTVERWLPGAVPGGDAITLRRLLNHTSGLFDYLNDGDKTVLAPYLAGHFGHVWTPQALVGVATSHPPNFAPGARWSYSNTGYILLGMVVQAVTGHPLSAELQTRIVAPLGLTGTSLPSSRDIAGRHAHGYYRLGGRLTDVTRVSPSYAGTAGAVVSTARDMAVFFRALLGGRLLAPDLLAQMQTTVPMGPPGEDYGLGLWHTSSFGFPVARSGCTDRGWGHDGDLAGYRSVAFASEDGRRQVVVLVNDDTLSRRAERALARVVGDGFCL